jgi:hypothetical protein
MSKSSKGIIGIINDAAAGRTGVWFTLWSCKLDQAGLHILTVKTALDADLKTLISCTFEYKVPTPAWNICEQSKRALVEQQRCVNFDGIARIIVCALTPLIPKEEEAVSSICGAVVIARAM